MTRALLTFVSCCVLAVFVVMLVNLMRAAKRRELYQWRIENGTLTLTTMMLQLWPHARVVACDRIDYCGVWPLGAWPKLIVGRPLPSTWGFPSSRVVVLLTNDDTRPLWLYGVDVQRFEVAMNEVGLRVTQVSDDKAVLARLPRRS